MPLALSVYFEIVRFTAALVVLLSHAWPIFFPASPLPWPGHDAVVVFFVLSGYVISHASETKDTTLWRYVLSRTSRILCVTIPALLLGAVVAVYVGTPAADIAIPSLLNAVFLGQSWTLNVGPPENAPYWSLCYEVWYYAIFGAAFYLTGSRRWDRHRCRLASGRPQDSSPHAVLADRRRAASQHLALPPVECRSGLFVHRLRHCLSCFLLVRDIDRDQEIP